MEVMENVASLERTNMMMHLNNASLESHLLLDDKTSLSEKLEKLAQNKVLENCRLANGMVDLGLLEQNEDEGEIMLLAMILLQLHGVKLPVESPHDVDEGHNKKKRQRTSPEQLAILEQIFQTDKMPNQQTRVQLADQLGMSSRRVQIWFQNKRAKVKRSQTKEEPALESPGSQGVNRRDSMASSSSDLGSEPPSPTLDTPSSPLDSPTIDDDEPFEEGTPKNHQVLSNGAKRLKSSQEIPPSANFTTTQLQLALNSLESAAPLLLPNEYNALRLQSMFKN